MTGALLFDLDGTMLISDPIHQTVFRDMFAERGRSFDEDDYMTLFHGKHNLESFPVVFPGEDAQALSEQKEALFRDRLTSNVPPMPGLHALLDQAAAQGWRVAVVTNAPRDNAVAMLAALGVTDRIDALVIGEECSAAKPDPTPYRVAMDRLGVAPDRAIAFEDSASGMRAAAASGAFAVGIRSGCDDATLRAAGAQITLQDFTDTALPAVLARLQGDIS
ncbi:HAD-IA family hydrolase [Mesobacterium sp. TK19101]|uniref:HAD-IA family hydrolase n=1 Tax=Mesobacterium hydrothermale TaxID=3111907 RepID=A0ABU6HEN6_9RHOB|nr:HAD-IA family hydrolase [Mesobacterium sp. TK19101]MEC3860577.1 HAD-IA family hydrolase [Mesobacterium sp. TK19101]